MSRPRFWNLTSAERAVVRGLRTGRVTALGDGMLPGVEAGEDRQVRASLIRYLALGAPGSKRLRLHEHGLQIAAALIVSDGQADPLIQVTTPGLDLQGCQLEHDLLLANCRFEHVPALRGARIRTLSLEDSHLPGLQADGLEVLGFIFLRGVRATGELCFLRARIGGDFDCEGGRFENAGGDALNADGLEAQGNVNLRRGFEAHGEVRLLRARIDGDLDCEGGRFKNEGGRALSADGAWVAGAFFWREGSDAKGALGLNATELGHIADDPACWPGAGDLLLNRCRYGAFTGKGISAEERIRWLDLQSPEKYGHDFWPQPWEQCAKVLREMGHVEDARKVLIAKEERQRAVARARFRRATEGTWREMLCPLPWLRDGALWLLLAYGHRPLQALAGLAVFWLVGFVVFSAAYDRDAFKPNNAFVLRSPEWAQCADTGERRADHASTLVCYLDQPEAAGYPKFNGLLYSLDTLVPVVDLEVQDFWVPDERVAAWARVYLWLHIALGWFLALLAVAGFSGLIRPGSGG
ncbi:hypothetical protein [Roseovarius aestuariivivens]|uniref:hypothetical protein n=1 Tax=Roseovarius aestuariivivens TaxID=1888910 RepID=UPI0010800F3D|nr:hypothetical protein [Roseovarius aestuariivivens]